MTEIIYSNNLNTHNICKADLIKLIEKKHEIFRGIINGKYYIVKKNNNPKELQNFTKIVKTLENQLYNIFFVTINGIIKCDNNYLYIMENITLPEIRDTLMMYNSKWRTIFLLQSLVTIFIFNHKIGLYHNDLYYKTNIRNIMIDDIYGKTVPTVFTFKENDILLDIPTEHFCIKMIDFGWSSEKPDLRTKEYHQKYFDEFPYISEILLFIYFYFMTFKQDILTKLKSRAKKILKVAKNRKEFDLLLIKDIYNRFHKFL